MITITKSNRGRFCIIDGELPKDVLTVLDDALSCMKKGVQYSTQYRLGNWDGKIHMLIQRPLQNRYIFPAGALSTVEMVFTLMNMDYTFVNMEDTYDYEHNIMNFEWKSEKQLYDYQRDIIDSLAKKNYSGVLELPTGSGKTLTALWYAKTLNLPFLVLVHRSELLYQWKTEIESILGETPILIGDTASAKKVRAAARKEETEYFKTKIADMKASGVKTKDLPKLKDFTYKSDDIQIIENASDAKKAISSCRCCVAMVQTLHSFMKNRASGFGILEIPVVIADECHTCPADSVFDVLYRCTCKYICGLSATAVRNDGLERKMFAIIGDKIKSMNVESLVDRNILAEPMFYMLYPEPPEYYCGDFTYCTRPNYQTVYTECIVEGQNRNNLIADFVNYILSTEYTHQVYIHVTKIAHGEILQSMIPNSVCCFGNTKNRRQIMDDFREGKITCLISTLLKEGVSIPDIDVLVYAAGGKSEIATIQTIGRALRRKTDGRKAIIVDVYDVVDAYLIDQTQQRIKTYEKFYGKLFNPKYIADMSKFK